MAMSLEESENLDLISYKPETGHWGQAGWFITAVCSTLTEYSVVAQRVVHCIAVLRFVGSIPGSVKFFSAL